MTFALTSCVDGGFKTYTATDVARMANDLLMVKQGVATGKVGNSNKEKLQHAFKDLFSFVTSTMESNGANGGLFGSKLLNHQGKVLNP